MLLAIHFGIGLPEAAAQQTDTKPNIVMICVDDLNDWVGYLSREPNRDLLDLIIKDPQQRKRLKNFLTPNIDRLAASGVAFTRAYCNSPLCGPSRASFLTGLHPSTTGYYFHKRDFRTSVENGKNIVTLPQHLKQHGYLTIEAGKVFHRSRGGLANKPAPAQSDPISWSAQHVQWGGTSWTFKPINRDGKDYPGNPWQYDPDTTRQQLEKFGAKAQLPMAQRWHAGRIKLDYFSKYFYWGVLPAPGDKRYHPRDWHTLETTFDYLQADYVASFLNGQSQLDTNRFKTDIAPCQNRVVNGFPIRENGQPFFIAYGGRLPHDPFIVPESFANDLRQIVSVEDLNIDALERLNQSIVGYGGIGRYGNRLARLAELHKIVTESGSEFHNDRQHYWRQALFMYLASIKFSDDCVGRVLDGLDQSTEKDNTIVIMLSDHGWHLGSKEHWSKMTLWEESLHVPFIIKVPGIKPAVCKRPVDLLSIYSTVLDLTNLPTPQADNQTAQTLDSKSIATLLSNPEQPWNQPILVSYQDDEQMECFAAVDEQWKLIHYCYDGEEELYDLLSDPFEQRNILKRPEIASEDSKLAYHHLRQSIIDQTKNSPDHMLGIKSSSPIAFKKPIDLKLSDDGKNAANKMPLRSIRSTTNAPETRESLLAQSFHQPFGPAVFSLLAVVIMITTALTLANFEFSGRSSHTS